MTENVLDTAIKAGRFFRLASESRAERAAFVGAMLLGNTADAHPSLAWIAGLSESQIVDLELRALVRADRLRDWVDGSNGRGWTWSRALLVREDLEGVRVLLRYAKAGEELCRTLEDTDSVARPKAGGPLRLNAEDRATLCAVADLDPDAWWGARG